MMASAIPSPVVATTRRVPSPTTMRAVPASSLVRCAMSCHAASFTRRRRTEAPSTGAPAASRTRTESSTQGA